MLKDSAAGYGLATIALHWVCGLLIIFLFGLGVYMRGLDYYSPWYHRGPELHIALGLALWLLMLLRVLWRIHNPSPAPIPSLSKANISAAHSVQLLLYVGFFAVSISGYLITTGEGQGANFFDLARLPASIELSSDNIDRAGLVHKYVAWALMGLCLLHTLAALGHHFIYRDQTLVRMLKPTAAAD